MMYQSRFATGGSYDRAPLDDGWYFLLPAAWTSTGAVTFSAVVDPRGIHSDPDRNNNTVAKTISFQNQPPMCVWTVPVRTHTPLPSTKDPNFWGMVSHFTRRWPVPDTWIYRDTEPVEELEVCWYGSFPYPCYGPYELSAELRIPKDAVGEWDHLVGLAFGHHALNASGDDYPWPYRSEWGKPNTSAAAALGDQPVITSLPCWQARPPGRERAICAPVAH